MAERMTEQEYLDFMRGTHTGKVSTVRADGSPHVAPIWFDLDDDGTILFTTGEASVKGRNLRRDPRVSICVDDETPPYAFVLVDGAAELSEVWEDRLRWAIRMAGRYLGADRAEEAGRRNATADELLVRVKPQKVLAVKNLE